MLGSVIPGASMSNSTLTIPLPKSWPAKVRSAMLHVVSLAKYAAVYTRSWAADCPKARVRLRTERDRHQEDNALLREELRIKDARMASIPAHHRPFYRPKERLAILELKAARGWSLEQTAERFFVCPKTIASWMKRLDERGAAALVQLLIAKTDQESDSSKNKRNTGRTWQGCAGVRSVFVTLALFGILKESAADSAKLGKLRNDCLIARKESYVSFSSSSP
jgi:hypothetical protein